MNVGILITFIVIGGVVCSEVLSCDSCGRECASSCGTRQFRACCYNYLRKRTSTAPIEMDPSMRLELWLARSRGARSASLEAPPSNTNTGLYTPRHYGNNVGARYETSQEDAPVMLSETM